MVNDTCPSGLLLPILNESGWPIWLRAALYLAGLLYSFLGVAIIADVFMVSIERITSKTYKVAVKKGPSDTDSVNSEVRYREVHVWNPTVANLTLMALGSSAPEILLAIIETVGAGFKAGKLGPGTIVGSAAYNLMLITAICMISVPGGGSRRIEQIYVFITTAAFSAFAYIWLLIILMGFSPGEVEVWEGFLTLFWFFALTIGAWSIDRQLCIRKRPATTRLEMAEKDVMALKDEDVTTPLSNGGQADGVPLNRHGASYKDRVYAQVQRQVAIEFPNLPPEDLAVIVAARLRAEEPRSSLYYRIAATRWMDGRRRKLADEDEIAATVAADTTVTSTTPIVESMSQSISSLTGTLKQLSQKTYIEFAALVYGFTDKDKHVRLRIIRRGKVNRRLMFKYETADGSAKKMEHYLPKTETLVFLSGETEKIVVIDLAHGADWAFNSGFFCRLYLEDVQPKTKIGSCSPASLRYVESKESPTFEFVRSNYSCTESQMLVRLEVHRLGNPDVAIALQWQTTDVTAENGKDFEGGTGEMKFEAGEILKFLDIVIIDDKEEEKAETFEVRLTEASAGAAIGPRSVATVTIISDDGTREMFMQLDKLMPHAFAKFALDAKGWRDQFFKAASINEGDTANATWKDLLTHILAFPWKILCAFIPPARLLGGYLAFIVALGVIGLVTAIIGDLATIFGCLIGLKDEVVAITLVAMGTSLPDTFASRIATQTDKTADNAIGNVTGSNSVNVFLGLGLPWFMAACYWHSQGKTFKVEAGSLGFSVTIYTICSVLCLILLAVRRTLPMFGQAELGGNKTLAWASAGFLFFLWFAYIVLSSLQVYNIIPAQF